MRHPILFLSFIAVFGCTAAALAAGVVQPLPVNNLYTDQGKATPLKAGVTYEASKTFSTVAPRFTPSDGSWAGAQWKTTSWVKKPPFFGWVGIGQGPTSAPPLGQITIMTMLTRTPSVAATTNWLRARGNGATYGTTSTVTLAGFKGSQFDGTITGKGHAFLAFSHPTGASQPYGDTFWLDKGGLFRIILLDVRGHTVVIYIERAGLSADQFPAFLTRATKLLNTLKFAK